MLGSESRLDVVAKRRMLPVFVGNPSNPPHRTQPEHTTENRSRCLHFCHLLSIVGYNLVAMALCFFSLL